MPAYFTTLVLILISICEYLRNACACSNKVSNQTPFLYFNAAVEQRIRRRIFRFLAVCACATRQRRVIDSVSALHQRHVVTAAAGVLPATANAPAAAANSRHAASGASSSELRTTDEQLPRTAAAECRLPNDVIAGEAGASSR